MFLEATVEEGCCKGVKTTLFCKPCGMRKPEMIAVPAPFFLSEGNLSKKQLERITFLLDDR
jgi:hypothetical protein